MNRAMYMILCFGLISSCSTIHGAKKFRDKIKYLVDTFKGYKYEKIDQKEYSALSVDNISIDNINGPITIKTGWKKSSLFLKTTKRAKKETDLNNIKIIRSTHNNHLTITTKHIDPKLVGLVEYELIVPASLHINLTISGNGDVCIKDINGTINVTTNDNITITNTQQSVSARTLKKGSISIANALGPVEAYAHYGHINGENIANSFTAHSTSGKINITYKTLPPKSAIDLKSTSGNIMLALPTDTNAEIRGHTMHGTILSDHYITIKPYATQLNNMAWNKFKKEVDGTLGAGQSTIALSSINGNLKIAEVKLT